MLMVWEPAVNRLILQDLQGLAAGKAAYDKS